MVISTTKINLEICQKAITLPFVTRFCCWVLSHSMTVILTTEWIWYIVECIHPSLNMTEIWTMKPIKKGDSQFEYRISLATCRICSAGKLTYFPRLFSWCLFFILSQYLFSHIFILFFRYGSTKRHCESWRILHSLGSNYIDKEAKQRPLRPHRKVWYKGKRWLNQGIPKVMKKDPSL